MWDANEEPTKSAEVPVSADGKILLLAILSPGIEPYEAKLMSEIYILSCVLGVVSFAFIIKNYLLVFVGVVIDDNWILLVLVRYFENIAASNLISFRDPSFIKLPSKEFKAILSYLSLILTYNSFITNDSKLKGSSIELIILSTS